MDARSLRTPDLGRWSIRSARYMVPVFTALLLIGGVLLALAWSEGRDALDVAKRKDAMRADRSAASITTIVDERWLDLQNWSLRNTVHVRPGNESTLRPRLQTRAGVDAGTATVAWLVVRPNGAIAAIGERDPGRVAASGISDSLSAFGRTVSQRGTRAVSDRLRFGDENVYAIGVPLDAGLLEASAQTGALIAVEYIERSSLGALVPDAPETDINAASLLDARGRTLTGRSSIASGDDLVSRPVAETGWTLVLTRESLGPRLPTWAYPAFALVLVLLAGVYVLQEINRRRLQRVNLDREGQVRTLYLLASTVLHARSVREQAELLAMHVLDLVPVTGVRVRVANERDAAGIISGVASPGDRRYSVAITGPRHPLGELVVYRNGHPPDAEERAVLQTAATLVGAAMHTIETLETERSTAAELQRLDELRSNLLATVAHELRSPLTAVKGVLGLLSMQDDLGARGREYVNVATERTDRLVMLIQDLFDCSLLETGQLDIRPQRQRADELLESALGAQAATRAGELVLSATPNLMITVDPVRFDQLVNNLVTNAFRHGAPPIEVSVRPWKDGAMVVVADEGPGIPQADRERIFGKFWQGSTGHARLVEGAGLGLSLVQGLVNLHGGHIEIDATHADGRGARFTAYFPDVVPGMGERERGSVADADLDPITRIM